MAILSYEGHGGKDLHEMRTMVEESSMRYVLLAIMKIFTVCLDIPLSKTLMELNFQEPAVVGVPMMCRPCQIILGSPSRARQQSCPGRFCRARSLSPGLCRGTN